VIYPARPLRARRPRLGFLGLGWIGRHRLEAVARCGIAEIVAVADTALDPVASVQSIVPDARTMHSLDELLDLELDGLVIATPSALHAEHSLAALQQGIAVFCQKPLGRDTEETRRVVDAARAADRLLGVDFCYRWTEAAGLVRRLVCNGELGRIFAADLVFHNAYGPDKPWFYDPALSGGGCVIDLGIHLVDLVLWMLDQTGVGEVSARLFANGAPLSTRPTAIEDYAVATLDLPNGTVARVACSWKLAAGRDAVISAEFYGTHGSAAITNVDGSFYDFTASRARGTATEILCRPPDPWGGRAITYWVKALADGAGFDTDVDRLVGVAEAVDAIYGRCHNGAAA
jgi:predicted dehydrogenase